MRNTFAVVLSTAWLAACGRSLDSITPAVTVEQYLAVPAHDHFYDVVATLKAPSGYHVVGVQLQGESQFDLHRRKADPDIRLRSTLPPSSGYEPDLSLLTRCEPSQDREELVVRREPRPDGEVVVCRERERNGGWPPSGTLILRNFMWRDQWLQCGVGFWNYGDIEGPSDEGKPSAARIDDAIAICDSVTIREMTDADVWRLYPPEITRDPVEGWYPPLR